jgi:hypothetical protein
LRGYLGLFDQMLANEFAQLGHFASLVSAKAEARTYAAGKVPRGEPGLPPIVDAGFHRAALEELVENKNSVGAVGRRNRFLDHLLARFGETVTDNPVAVRNLTNKRDFLRDMPRLSGARGTGVNYLSAEPSAPALADRVRLRLGLPADPDPRFLVVEHILLRALQEDATNDLPLLEAASRSDPFSSQLSFVFSEALHEIKPLVELVAREETPAHLVPHFHWLDPAAFSDFNEAYNDWLGALRDHRRTALGIPRDAPDPPETEP